MPFLNFIWLGLSLTLLGVLIVWRLPAPTRYRLLAKNAPAGYMHHQMTSEPYTLMGAPDDLPQALVLSSLEMYHSRERARLILRYTVPPHLCAAEHIAPWSDALMRGVLDATEVHVVMLEVFDDTTHTLQAQLMMTHDDLGWSGDRFDQVRQVSSLITQAQA